MYLGGKQRMTTDEMIIWCSKKGIANYDWKDKKSKKDIMKKFADDKQGNRKNDYDRIYNFLNNSDKAQSRIDNFIIDNNDRYLEEKKAEISEAQSLDVLDSIDVDTDYKANTVSEIKKAKGTKKKELIEEQVDKQVFARDFEGQVLSEYDDVARDAIRNKDANDYTNWMDSQISNIKDELEPINKSSARNLIAILRDKEREVVREIERREKAENERIRAERLARDAEIEARVKARQENT